MSVELHLGDCLQFMRSMPDKSVDAVITDPPYGVRDDAWDDMGALEFSRFSMAWMSEARRMSTSLVVFCAKNNVIETIARMIYADVRKMIWHKPLGSQYAGSSEAKLWFSYEVILFCYEKSTWEVVKPKDLAVAALIRAARVRAGLSRGGVDMVVRGKKTGLCYRWEEAACIPTPEQIAKLKTFLTLGEDFDDAVRIACQNRDDTREKAAEKAAEKAPEKADVFIYAPAANGRHPTEKPEGLMKDLLETVGIDFPVIFDPFMGSGTTGVACVQTGRNFIGCEIDPTYFAIAEKRIAAAQLQVRMPI